MTLPVPGAASPTAGVARGLASQRRSAGNAAERVEWAPQPGTPRAEEAQAQVRRWDVSQPGGDPVVRGDGTRATEATLAEEPCETPKPQAAVASARTAL